MSSDNTDSVVQKLARAIEAWDPATAATNIQPPRERGPTGGLILPKNKVAYSSQELFDWQRDPATHNLALAALLNALVATLRLCGHTVLRLTDLQFVVNFASQEVLVPDHRRFVFKVREPAIAEPIEIWQVVNPHTLATEWRTAQPGGLYLLPTPEPEVIVSQSTRDTERTRIVSLD